MLPRRRPELLDGVLAAPGEAQRRAIAKAITLLESTPRRSPRARRRAARLRCPRRGRPSFRLGVSGVPGVGKSTFIETLGLHLIGAGHRVAVLAVDPSSSVSGGSILGDKTRMERLSVDPAAFVRPSPSGGTLGGVAAATREAIRVVEAAGYDVVVVETVGVGQSEAAVAGMTDMFLLLQLPNAGDDLQAIKKGVMELADLVVVNKADLDAARGGARGRPDRVGAAPRLRAATTRPGSRACCRRARSPPAQVAAVWRVVESFRAAQEASGALHERRRGQARAWLWERDRRRPARCVPRPRRGARAARRRRSPRSTPGGCRCRSRRAGCSMRSSPPRGRSRAAMD